MKSKSEINRNFENFLKRHSIRKAFEDNLNKSGMEFDMFLENTPEHKYINGAFDWEHSNEGYEFWKKYAEMWWDLFDSEEIDEFNLFMEFLEQINAKDAFINNASEQLSDKKFKHFPFAISPEHYIKAAFRWDKTEQGGMLWAMTNVAWKMELTKHKHGG